MLPVLSCSLSVKMLVYIVFIQVITTQHVFCQNSSHSNVINDKIGSSVNIGLESNEMLLKKEEESTNHLERTSYHQQFKQAKNQLKTQPTRTKHFKKVNQRISSIEKNLKKIEGLLKTQTMNLDILLQMTDKIKTKMINLKRLNLKNIPPKVLNIIKNLDLRVKNVVRQINSLIQSEAVQQRSNPNIQVIEKLVNNMENDFNKIDIKHTSKEVQEQILNVSAQLNTILTQLERIDHTNIPEQLLQKLKNIERLIVDYENAEHLKLQNENKLQTNEYDTAPTLESSFKTSKRCYLLQNIKDQECEDTTNYQNLQNNMRNQEHTDITIDKTTDHKEDIIKTHINIMESQLNKLKHQLFLNRDSYVLIKINYQVQDILDGLTALRVQNIPHHLWEHVEVLQQSTNSFKVLVQLQIKSKILNPLNNYIDDLLVNLDSLDIPLYKIITRSQVASIKKDLISLKRKVMQLFDFKIRLRQMIQIKRDLGDIVERLKDLKSSHLSSILDSNIEEINGFYGSI